MLISHRIIFEVFQPM